MPETFGRFASVVKDGSGNVVVVLAVYSTSQAANLAGAAYCHDHAGTTHVQSTVEGGEAVEP